jgi:threonine aldolase
MSNQVAIMAWTQPGDEIITWSGAHIVQLEQGAASVLSGVVTRMVDSKSGVLTAEQGFYQI